MLARRIAVIAVALLGVACDSGGASRADGAAAACTSPAAADTFDAATSVGCKPNPAFRVCEVPSGATLNPDGTYTPPATAGPVPTPSASLGCDVLPIPTPSNVTVYCCACARGGG